MKTAKAKAVCPAPGFSLHFQMSMSMSAETQVLADWVPCHLRHMCSVPLALKSSFAGTSGARCSIGLGNSGSFRFEAICYFQWHPLREPKLRHVSVGPSGLKSACKHSFGKDLAPWELVRARGGSPPSSGTPSSSSQEEEVSVSRRALSSHSLRGSSTARLFCFALPRAKCLGLQLPAVADDGLPSKDTP